MTVLKTVVKLARKIRDLAAISACQESSKTVSYSDTLGHNTGSYLASMCVSQLGSAISCIRCNGINLTNHLQKNKSCTFVGYESLVKLSE